MLRGSIPITAITGIAFMALQSETPVIAVISVQDVATLHVDNFKNYNRHAALGPAWNAHPEAFASG